MTKHRLIPAAAVAALLALGACGGTDSAEPAMDEGALAAPPSATLQPNSAADSQLPDVPPAVAGGMAPEPAPGTGSPEPPLASAPAGGGAAPGRPAPAPATPAPAGTVATDILERAEQVYAGVRSMEADFVQEVYVPLLDRTQHSRGRIFHRSPDRFLMRFSDPAGDVIVADGTYIWMYYPSTDPRQVMRSALGAGGERVDLHREFLSDASSRFSAVRTGAEPIGGRPAHALTLTPRGASPYRQIRLWVDTQDFLVRRFEIVEQNETERKLELSNLRTNVTLGDDLFRFTPPPGAQVFEP